MSIEDIVQEVRNVQDKSLDEGDARARVRQRLLAEPRRRQTTRVRHALFAAACVAATCLVVVGMALAGVFATGAEPLHYEVDALAEQANGMIADEESVSVAFSDGSNVVISPGSHASVPATTPLGATVVVEAGQVFFDVEHKEETDWRVHAGPYVVHVVGTSFDVGWDANTGVFELHVREGEVRLEGRGELRRVRTGESVTLGTAPQENREGSMAAPEGSPLEGAAGDDDDPESADALSSPPPSPRRSGVEEWRARGLSGDVEGALAILDAESFRGVLRRSEVADLMLLGGWARRARDARAGTLYEAVRTRFAGTESAADAAFLLGRMSSSPEESLRWWRIYEAEAPGGRFARENAGRILESLQALGRAPELRRQAEHYLRNYERGPHADLAEAALR